MKDIRFFNIDKKNYSVLLSKKGFLWGAQNLLRGCTTKFRRAEYYTNRVCDKNSVPLSKPSSNFKRCKHGRPHTYRLNWTISVVFNRI